MNNWKSPCSNYNDKDNYLKKIYFSHFMMKWKKKSLMLLTELLHYQNEKKNE